MSSSIPGQVEGGGPIFDMPHPEADDVDETVTWYEILQAAVGK